MTTKNGLTTKQAKELQDKYGKNVIKRKRSKWISRIIYILKEPIYLLLSSSSMIYFVLGETLEGAIMIAFVFFVIGIDLMQESRTGKTLRKLKELSAPKITVIRDGIQQQINSEDLVPGDCMVIAEGVKIPADGIILYSSGLCIDESILTGEAEGVWKEEHKEVTCKTGEEDHCQYRKDYCYAGTLVILGSGVAIVDKIGISTEYGKLADHMIKVPEKATKLQIQMKKLASQCTVFAFVLFLLVFTVTYLNIPDHTPMDRVIESILAGVVLALSMIPGEFPVILSVFLSMGALRLVKNHALIRKLPAVETLGAISVLCIDKTGTVTENNMKVEECYAVLQQEDLLCKAMALSCKTEAYDPMERAMLDYCAEFTQCDKELPGLLKICSITNMEPKLIREFSFTNELKAMGQIWLIQNDFVLAAKGSTETILPLCDLSHEMEQLAQKKILQMSSKGLRVIAIADQIMKKEEMKNHNLPQKLTDANLTLRGIIGLMDPVRENMMEQIHSCQKSGIRIVMITGDHAATAVSIAGKIGITKHDMVLTGNDIEKLSKEELQQKVKECNIYARVLPLHKMKIVEALQENREVVAMIGDGVNDSPAQKMADIGIAMGKHGSEVAREAADVVLLDDNFATILNAIKDGRRIYKNIGKAVGYVLTIHIPIALISLFAPILSISPKDFFLLPLHIVLLELVMDPTCSVALERQPPEDHILLEPPRNPYAALLPAGLFIKSILQGILIFIAAFFLYYGLLLNSYSAETARTAGFTILVMSNIFLVLVNCSERESIITTITKIKNDRGIWFVTSGTLIGLCIMIYSPLARFMKFTPLTLPLLLTTIIVSFLSVIWYEIVKKYKIKRFRDKN